MRSRTLAPLLAVAGLFALPDDAACANCTWTGAGSTPLWSNPANWTCDSSGVIPQQGDAIVFLSGGPPDSENDIADLQGPARSISARARSPSISWPTETTSVRSPEAADS